MSAAASESKCEPDLTALLDLVLQMVMFFMLVTNLIVIETSPGLVLPKSVTARGLTDKQGRLVYINIPYPESVNGRQGKQVYELSFAGSGFNRHVNSPIELTNELKPRYESDRIKAEKSGKLTQFTEKGEGLSTIIVRADHRLEWKVVREVEEAISAAGYKVVQKRVLKP